MKITAIKTRKFLPPKDDLLGLLKQAFAGFKLKEKSIFVVTSKVVSIGQGRCLKIDRNTNKDKLIKKEADLYLDRELIPKRAVVLTVKNNIVIPSAGVDESNAKGYYVLWPQNPFAEAQKIYNFIEKNYKLKKFGLIISDSHTTPQRNGVVGMGIAWHGFYPLKDYRGKKDIFGRAIKLAQSNIVDSLSSAAVFEMGEGKEQKPVAVIEGAENIKFDVRDYSKNNPLVMPADIDIYAPLLKSVKWKTGK